MKKLLTMAMVVMGTAMVVMGAAASAAYYNDPTQMDYTYNNGYGYGYNQYNYNCTGIRTSYSNYEYQPSPWFDVYKQQYGVQFHIVPTMPISRNDVFAPVGKAMDRAYSRSGRRFSNSYGVNFVDYTWNSSLNQIAGGLYQRGIMIGYSEDNTVRFPQNITRAELAKVLVLTAKENGINGGYTNINAQFQDTIGHWAEQYVAECNALGLMVGRSSYSFDPEANVTYEEYVTVMLRMAERANGNVNTGYNNGYGYNNYYNYSNYSMTVEDVEYGISSTMDIDFNAYNSYVGDNYYTTPIYDSNVYVTKIRLNPTEVELEIGESQSITATVSPSNASKGIVWESHNTRVATVNQNGRITAVGVGNTTVTATAKDGSGVVATIDVTVYAPEVQQPTRQPVVEEPVEEPVVVTPSDTTAPVVEITGADNVSVGQFVTLTVKVNDDNLSRFEISEADLLGLTGGASINKITKVSNDTYEIKLMGVEVSSLALCINSGVATDVAGNTSAESNEVIIFINSGEEM